MQVLLALLASMSIFFLILPLFLCLGGIGAVDAASVRLRG
jgi:hypothetical protein